MSKRPPRDPQRLSATQLAELAVCEARMVRARMQGEVNLPVSSGKQQARDAGVAEHNRFHAQVSQFHNQGVAGTHRTAPPTVQNTRGDDTQRVVAPGRPEGSTYCFIATQLYGTTHPRTWQLRRFRERCLRPSAPGRWLVVRYYRIAPGIARWLERHRRCQTLIRTALDGLCLLLTPWTKE